MDDKQNEVLLLIMQNKRKQLKLEEKQRELEISKIQQAILLRENMEADRKQQLYNESELLGNQQYQEQEKLKSKEHEYLLITKSITKNEELNKLEDKIVQRQKYKLQFQMLEQQRKTNSFLFY